MNTNPGSPDDRAKGRFCVILPAFREEKRIAAVVRSVLAQGVDAIVIDDGSDDRTAEEAAQAGGHVIRHATNCGKGVALNTGFKYANEQGYIAVITMDADGQHDPAELPKFTEAFIRTGIPVLVGNRMADVRDMPLIRRWTNEFMSWLLSRTMGQYVPDTQCGYRLYQCSVIPYVSAESERFAAESEVLLHVAARGIRIGSVRISTIYGDEKSKINPFSDTIRFVAMLWRFRKRARH